MSKEEKMIAAIRELNGDGWLTAGHVRGYRIAPKHFAAVALVDAWVSPLVDLGSIVGPNVSALGSGFMTIQARSNGDAVILEMRLTDWPMACPVNFVERDKRQFRFEWDYKELEESVEVSPADEINNNNEEERNDNI